MRSASQSLARNRSGVEHSKRQKADYAALIAAKVAAFEPHGFDPGALNPALKPHQLHATEFALRAGSAALFLDTGLA